MVGNCKSCQKTSETARERGTLNLNTLAKNLIFQEVEAPQKSMATTSSHRDPEASLVFLELFAGAAGLTGAVRRKGLPTRSPVDNYTVSGGFDLLRNGDFSKVRSDLRSGAVKWVHGGPPCKTFSRARRSDRHGTARILRSDRYPSGLPGISSQKLRDGNELARRMAKLCRTQQRAGGFWSIENPANSFMWMFPPVAALNKLPDVHFVVGDQCCFGGTYRKPTGWLTNAPFLKVLSQTCPGVPLHVKHPSLEGRVIGPDGVEVWLTELAAEYPQGLCESLAEAYAGFAQQPLTPADGPYLKGRALLDPLLPPTKRQRREASSSEALGGLRDPHKAVEQVPGWIDLGRKLAGVIDGHIQEHWGELKATLATIGQPESTPPRPEIIDTLRTKIREALELPPVAEEQGLRADIFLKLVTASADPETEVPRWLASHTPLGIVHPIRACGVFPPMSEKEQSKSAMMLVEQIGRGDFSNYPSYREHEDAANSELVRERDLGFLEWAESRHTLEEKYGPLTPSRVGVIVKRGQVDRVRLIHDLSRSGVNHNIRLPERLVLPRLSDAMHSVQELLSQAAPEEQVELLVLDFKDAFKHLHVHPDERPYLSGTGLHGWFVYLTVLFGIVSGPLVWGRVAALVMRATQALFSADRARIQCYVDDPLMAIRGSAEVRAKGFLRAILFWQTLGLSLSWHKGKRGGQVEWIGAQISVNHERKHIHLAIPPKKREQLATELTALERHTMVNRRDLRRFTGLVEWLAGFLPQLQPFAQQMWAAISSKGVDQHRVWRRQVDLAFKWLRALVSDSTNKLERTLSAVPPASLVCIAFDASTSGGGALIWILPTIGQPVAVATIPQRTPDAYMAMIWSHRDCKAAQAKRADSGSQARWEAYALLVAITTWQPVILASKSPLVAIGDALGMLRGATRFRSKDPVINCMFMQMALAIGREGRTIEALHLWSQQNKLADDLSRASEGVPTPTCLKSVPPSVPLQGPWRLLDRAPQAPSTRADPQ